MDEREEYINKIKQEIRERNKQEQIRENEEFQARRRIKSETPSREVSPGYTIDKLTKEKHARGEIIDVFIKQYLDGKIVIARWILALAMTGTILFKGQWVLWIIFIIIYKTYITTERQKALEEDIRRHKKK